MPVQSEMELSVRNAELLGAGFQAFADQDMAMIQRTFSPDVVWHAQRLGALGGDHRGLDAVLQFFGQTMEMTAGTFRVEVKEILSNSNGAAAVVRSTATRGDRTLDSHQIQHFHIEDGQVVEVWQFVGDGPAVEAFWS
jgi:uncharacterized protein